LGACWRKTGVAKSSARIFKPFWRRSLSDSFTGDQTWVNSLDGSVSPGEAWCGRESAGGSGGQKEVGMTLSEKSVDAGSACLGSTSVGGLGSSWMLIFLSVSVGVGLARLDEELVDQGRSIVGGLDWFDAVVCDEDVEVEEVPGSD